MDRQTQQIIDALSSFHVKQSAFIQEQLLALSQVISRWDIVMLNEREESAQNSTMNLFQLDSSATFLREKYSLFKDPLEEEESLRKSVSIQILNSLLFSTINDRYERVAEAHERTFEWIYNDSPFEETYWSNFADWLQHGDGLYWIQGKAGSGKSTLMKYICDNPLTNRYLTYWAGEHPLHTAESYLWNIGTTLQKSQSGLLRKLLYDVLSQSPDLLPIILPRRWARLYLSRSRLVDDLKVSSSSFR
jgi:hypothetical protein